MRRAKCPKYAQHSLVLEPGAAGSNRIQRSPRRQKRSQSLEQIERDYEEAITMRSSDLFALGMCCAPPLALVQEEAVHAMHGWFRSLRESIARAL